MLWRRVANLMVGIYMRASRLRLLGSGIAMCVRVRVRWGLRFSDVFSHHQRRRPQACVSVCQRGGRMRNSLSVRGARVYALFVFVRSLLGSARELVLACLRPWLRFLACFLCLLRWSGLLELLSFGLP